MKSVGETMAIGRTFKEALQKGLRSLETGHIGLGKRFETCDIDRNEVLKLLRKPNSERLYALRNALRCGMTEDEVFEATKIDPWFLRQFVDIFEMEKELIEFGKKEGVSASADGMKDMLRKAKEYGYSDPQLAAMWRTSEDAVRALRKELDIIPTYYLVDTCAAEFEAYTPYYYSTYETGQENVRDEQKKIIILGGGPNRIGQGIEFDYCCCHSSFTLKEMGVQSIMVNSNPETVSTDYDTSDKLYFEPLTFEDVMNIVEFEKPDGVIVQFGGQTPLNLAIRLMNAGVPLIGTSPDAIDRAEDRERFKQFLNKLHLKQPPNGTAMSMTEAREVAENLDFPLVLRPSYVLGGRGMDIVYSMDEFEHYFRHSARVAPEHPVLIDKFLEYAIEVDVDALADGEDVYIGGVWNTLKKPEFTPVIPHPYCLPTA